MNPPEIEPKPAVRRKRRWLWSIPLLLLALLVSPVFLVQLPPVQRWLGQKVAAYLENQTGNHIEIDRLRIRFFSDVELQNVLVLDLQHDTIASIHCLQAHWPKISANALFFPHTQLEDAHFYMIGDSTGTTGFQRFIDALVPASQGGGTSSTPRLTLGRVYLHHSSFMLAPKGRKTPQNGAFDPDNMWFRNIDALVSDFSIHRDTIELQIAHLRSHEHGGLSLAELSGKFRYCSRELSLLDFQLSAGEGKLAGDLAMNYDSLADFDDFFNRVRWNVRLKKSQMPWAYLGLFLPQLRNVPGKIRLSGHITGTLNNLSSKNLLLSAGASTRLSLNLNLKNLENPAQMELDLDAPEIQSSYADLLQLPIAAFAGVPVEIPEVLKLAGLIQLQLNVKGSLNAFSTDVMAQTGLGNLSASLDMKNLNGEKPEYAGMLELDNLFLGPLINDSSLLGRVSAKGEIRGQGFGGSDFFLAFDGLIHQVGINNYTYKKIELTADMGPSIFTGRIRVQDPHAQLLFNGRIDFGSEEPYMDFIANIDRLDLIPLGFVFGDSIQQISTILTVKAKGINPDKLLGELRFENLRMRSADADHSFGDVLIQATQKGAGKLLSIESNVAEAELEGQFTIANLWNDIQNRIAGLSPATGFKKVQIEGPNQQNFTLSLRLKKPDVLTDLFLPDLLINSNSVVYGNYNAAGGDVHLNLKSGLIQWKEKQVHNLSMAIDTYRDTLRFSMFADQIALNDSMQIDRAFANADFIRDSMYVNLGFNNRGQKVNAGRIRAHTRFTDPSMIPLVFDHSYFYYQDSLWFINPDAEIRFFAKHIDFEDVQLLRENMDPILSIQGRAGPNHNDRLGIQFKQFPLAISNEFIGDKALGIGGIVDGDLTVFRTLSDSLPLVTADLKVQKLAMLGMVLGDLDLMSGFGLKQKREIELAASLRSANTEILSIKNSRLRPFQPEQLLDLEVQLNGLNLQFLQPLLTGSLNELKGIASGRILVKGAAEDPYINGGIYLEQCRVVPTFLNSPFNLDFQNQPIILTNRSVVLPDVKITDDAQGKGHLIGLLFHKAFQNMELNVSIDRIQQLQVMNTRAKDNEQFYGKAVVTSQDMLPRGAKKAVQIRGPLDNLLISAFVELGKGTKINLPIASSTSATENTFVGFVEPAAADSAINAKTERKKLKKKDAEYNLTVDLNLRSQKEAMYRVIFDETVGDVLTAYGSSENLRLLVDLKDKFFMEGAFTIERGDYLFTLSNLVNKPFVIKPGSTVLWSGDPLGAQINATAIHPVRASLFPLVSPFLSTETEAERYRRASRIFSELSLTGLLIDPSIGFGLSLPDEDESAKALVRSVLNSPDEINRQVFSLLIINSFLPPESIGSSGFGSNLAASGLGSNSLSLLSGQLNNWLGKVTRDVNINLDYQAGEQNRSERVMVGLQTQLFDNRVLIDTDLGVGGNDGNSGSNQNTVVGNVNIEVKATDDGRLRIRAFNRSNEFNLLKNSVPYTQGMGLSYQRDFETWSDLFKRSTAEKAARKGKANLETEREQRRPLFNDSDPEYLRERKDEFESPLDEGKPEDENPEPIHDVAPDPVDMD